MKYYILVLTSIFILSCSDDNITSFKSLEDATAGVLSIRTYTIDLSQLISIEDFEYNSQNKLTKKNYYGENKETIFYYENFYYDNNGRLKNKVKYNKNTHSPTGFFTIDSTVYNYSDNLLVSKQIIYPQANTFDEVRYEYEGGLVRTEKYYHNNNYTDKIIYEYKEGKIQNKFYYNSNDNITGTIKYVYEENYLTSTLRYSTNNELLTKTIYEYKNGKMIKETLEVVALYLSVSSHIAFYEY